MFFSILAAVCVLGVAYQLTYARYFATAARAEKKVGYFPWLWTAIQKSLTKKTLEKSQAVLKSWVKSYYPGWTQWVFWVLIASFVYLAASGFFFAIFIRREMFGVPLLVHVSVGALFSVSLALTLLLRARDYRLDQDGEVLFKGFARPVLKNVSKSLLQNVLFWIIAVAGFSLMVTALGSMVPVFSFEAQKYMIDVHRYAALASLLAAMGFVDIAFLPRPQAK